MNTSTLQDRSRKQMNVAAIVLAITLSFTQTVTFSNCCQGMLCPQKDACPPCPEGDRSEKNHTSGQALATDRDCCGERNSVPTDPSHGSTCFHLEPSTDVEQAPALEIATAAAIGSDFLFTLTGENPLFNVNSCISNTSPRAPNPLRESLRALHLPLQI